MKNPFLSLKYRNFRIYWVGMNFSLIGSWMQSIALPWLMLVITNDAFKVSIIAAVQFVPALIFSPFSGAIIDRFSKKLLLLYTQIGMAVIALMFAYFAFMGEISFTKIFTLTLINGVFSSFDAPCRQSIVPSLINEPKNLQNAVALNSLSFNTARILGPSFAGIIMLKFGVEYCFLFNAISFLAIIISLLFVNIKNITKKSQENIFTLSLPVLNILKTKKFYDKRC